MPNPNYPVLTREQKRRKQAIRNWKRAQRQLIDYCCKAQECVTSIRPYTEQFRYIPDEPEVLSFDVKPICDYLFITDDRYWDELDSNRLTSENVAEFCL